MCVACLFNANLAHRSCMYEPPFLTPDPFFCPTHDSRCRFGFYNTVSVMATKRPSSPRAETSWAGILRRILPGGAALDGFHRRRTAGFYRAEKSQGRCQMQLLLSFCF